MKKIELILPFLILTTAVGLHGQYTGTGSVSQGKATTTITGLYSCTGGRPTNVGVITASDGTVWTMPAAVRFRDTLMPFASDLHNSCVGALYSSSTIALSKLADKKDIVEIDADGEVITAFVFADNYFEMYINGVAVGKDKVPFTQFNSSIVRFKVKRPFTIAMLLVDWEENLGLGSEANGGFAYHPGDGGVVAVFQDEAANVVAITNKSWKAQTFYTSPITDLSCPTEKEGERLSALCSTQNTNSGASYYALHWQKPALWYTRDFDDTSWPNAYEYTNEVIGVNNKPAYTNFTNIFDNASANAQFIWSSNVILDNEVVVRYRVGGNSASSDMPQKTGVFLVPNPGSNALALAFEDPAQAEHIREWRLSGLDGKTWMQAFPPTLSADTAGLPQGLYLVSVSFQDRIIQKIWIKN